jgi:peptidoglycan-associated lipoprotein
MSSLRTITLCTLALATTIVGCARTPVVTSMTTLAPEAGPASSAPRTAVPSDAGPAATQPPSEASADTERPQPSVFAPDDGVKAVFFDFDRDEIRPDDARTLDADAAWLRTHDVQVLIEGQCDERGTDDYNLALGDRRAQAARNYLIAQGIAASRLSTVSYGKEHPVCAEHTEACWAANRRAHLVVKPQD